MPWRAKPGLSPDPYHVLLSEAMLQQTQVATVVPYFRRFIGAFPTIESLANADEQKVLRLWQGLGYYARARNLRKCANMIVERFGGKIPRTVDELLTLPGVGRYTAGAVASIAFGVRAPIVDGNVVRVICRLDAITDDPRDRKVVERIWARAGELVPDKRAGDFNQSMMELGATVCTPKNPACLICPVREFCKARKLGNALQIPVAKAVKPLKPEHRWVLCLRRRDGRYLVEQRPPGGRWANMWQFVTVDAGKGEPDRAFASKTCDVSVDAIEHLMGVDHSLTHRKYRFDAYVGSVVGKSKPVGSSRRWVTLEEAELLPFSKPQLSIRLGLRGAPTMVRQKTTRKDKET
jgi:A/G-specific adenine glycosylase